MQMNNYRPYRFPVSIKGIVKWRNQFLLLKNERDEWELPGGKLELGESPEACVEREIFEETGLQVQTVELVDLWVYTVLPEVHVLIVTYGCTEVYSNALKVSHEHKEARWFAFEEIPTLNMPKGYKDSIEKWVNRLPLKG